MSLLVKTEPLYTAGGAAYPDTAALWERFQLEDRFEEPYSLAHRHDGCILVPRRLAPCVGTDLTLTLPTAGFANRFKPRSEEQSRVVAESCNLMTLGVSHILQAPTGFGKTYVGCAVAAHVDQPTLVITTKDDIFDHWRGAAKAVLGLEDSQIGEWRGDIVPKPGQLFVIGMINSVLKGYTRYPASLYDRFGLVIPDEVHRMGADKFAMAMWWLRAKLRLGLSATPYRKDGKDLVFKSHIGDVAVVAKQESQIPRVIVKHTKWKCPRRLVKNKKTGKESWQPIPHKPGRTMHLMPSMVQCRSRNIEVAKFVRLAYHKGRATIVFADTMAHLKAMRDAVLSSGVPRTATGWYVGLDADVYEGGKADRKAQREKAKVKAVIFATYKMASEATDIPWLDTCVLGSPRGDVVQIVGRIRREHPDKQTPLVFDLVDDDSDVFDRYALSRQQWYRKLRCPVFVYR